MNPVRCILGLSFVALCATPARAHEGPPYPVMVDKEVGPYKLSLWADPDVGTGTFFVIFDPPVYRSETDPRVSIEVWPVTQRLEPVRYAGERQPDRAYKVRVEFDREEQWNVKLHVEGTPGTGEVSFDVPVTPPGYGRWDLLVYFTPFGLLGLLWVAVVIKKRKLQAAACELAESESLTE